MNEYKSSWITQALARGRNASPQTENASLQSEDNTEAEYLLAVGKLIQGRLRRGLDIAGLASVMSRPDDCEVGLAFAESPTALIFRALVEDWTYEQIKTTVL